MELFERNQYEVWKQQKKVSNQRECYILFSCSANYINTTTTQGDKNQWKDGNARRTSYTILTILYKFSPKKWRNFISSSRKSQNSR